MKGRFAKIPRVVKSPVPVQETDRRHFFVGELKIEER